MKTLVIINPQAGSAEDVKALLSALADRPDILMKETSYAGQAKELAQQAVQLDCHTVVVGGGDGTINEVVNGLALVADRPRFGLLPLGTGNDLAAGGFTGSVQPQALRVVVGAASASSQ